MQSINKPRRKCIAAAYSSIDINGDGVIDSTDVMALFNAINSGDDLDATVADVNGDGVIDARDVMALYNIIKSDN